MSKEIRKTLEERLQNEDSELVKYVIEDILEKEDDYLSIYMEDVMRHGCVSGIVGGLIYYHDTYKFYDEHYEEIEELRIEMLEQGINFFESIGSNDFKNTMAWIAYEETIRMIADELEVYA